MYDLVGTLGYQVSFQGQIGDSGSVLTSDQCPDASVACFAALLTISQAPVSSRPGDTDELFTCTHLRFASRFHSWNPSAYLPYFLSSTSKLSHSQMVFLVGPSLLFIDH